jgi:hypothetical protein
MEINAPFYVKDYDRRLVPAKFLVGPDGQYVRNPNSSLNTISQMDNHYFNANGTEIQNANPNNYLVVPYNYTLGHAIQFAGGVNNAPFHGTSPARTMVEAFSGDGSQNLQRAYQGLDGSSIQGGTHVPMFQDAASFHLGLVSALTGFGPAAAQIAGSAYDFKAQVPNWWNGKIAAGQAWDNNMRNMNTIAAGADYAGGYVPGPNPSNPNGALDRDYIDRPQPAALGQNALNSFLNPGSGALLGTEARAIGAFPQSGQSGHDALVPVQNPDARALNALLPRPAYFPGNALAF